MLGFLNNYKKYKITKSLFIINKMYDINKIEAVEEVIKIWGQDSRIGSMHSSEYKWGCHYRRKYLIMSCQTLEILLL